MTEKLDRDDEQLIRAKDILRAHGVDPAFHENETQDAYQQRFIDEFTSRDYRQIRWKIVDSGLEVTVKKSTGPSSNHTVTKTGATMSDAIILTLAGVLAYET